MAKALGVPVLDYTYDDCRLIARAKHLGIPGATAAREVSELKAQLGLEQSQLELQLASGGPGPRWLTREQFVERLGGGGQHADRLFQIFEQRASGLASWSDYLLCSAFLSLQHAPLDHLVCYAFKLYDKTGTGRLDQSTFEEVSTRCLGMCQEDADNLFRQIDFDEKGYITYDEFISYAQKRPELSFVFSCEAAQTKPKSQ
ncbi:lysophosphatidylcholine acyltransferase [Aphomia sociella]